MSTTSSQFCGTQEERRLELLALARRSRVKWVVDASDKNLEQSKLLANEHETLAATRSKFPAAECIQSVFEVLADIIDDGEVVDVDSVISLIPNEKDLDNLPNAPVPQYDGPDGPRNPYVVFIEKLRHMGAIDIVKPMQKFVAKFEQSMRDYQLQLTMSDPIATVEDERLSSHTIQSIWTFIEYATTLMRSNFLWASETDVQREKTKQSCEKFMFVKLHNQLFACDVNDSHLDKKLHDRIESLGFLTGEHLDIKHMFGKDNSVVLNTPIQILRRLIDAKCPDDKLAILKKTSLAIAVVLKELKPKGATPGADEFLPLMILTIKECNPSKLNSTVKYLQRFTHPSKLASEAGYLLTHFVSAVHFLEHVDAQALTISPEEFENSMRSCIAYAKTKNEIVVTRQNRIYEASISAGAMGEDDSSTNNENNPPKERRFHQEYSQHYDEFDLRWKYYGPPSHAQAVKKIHDANEALDSIHGEGSRSDSPSKSIRIGINGVVVGLEHTSMEPQHHADQDVTTIAVVSEDVNESQSLAEYLSIYDELLSTELAADDANGTSCTNRDVQGLPSHSIASGFSGNPAISSESSLLEALSASIDSHRGLNTSVTLSNDARRAIVAAVYGKDGEPHTNISDLESRKLLSGRFANASADTLTVGDVADLLAEYKLLLQGCVALTEKGSRRQ